MVFLNKAALLALGLLATGRAMKATILADTNRDGVVDESDSDGKNLWTDGRGALFLANIADTDKVQSEKLAELVDYGDPVELLLDTANDAGEKELRNPQNLAPLLIPAEASIPEDALVFIRLSGTVSETNGKDHSQGKVRIFVERDEKWKYMDLDEKGPHFTGGDLHTEIKLGIDARDVRRPDGWDGIVTVTLDVFDKAYEASKEFEETQAIEEYRKVHRLASDSVQLRVAPVLIQHALQDPKNLYIGVPAPSVFGDESSFRMAQNAFEITMDQRVSKVAGLKNIKFSHSNGVWARDLFAPGYMSIPGPGGEPVVVQLLLMSSRTDFEDYAVFTQLRDATTGAVRHKVTEEERASLEDQYEGLGNLVIIPPYTSTKDVRYPAGRAIMGSGKFPRTAMSKFLDAQGVQMSLDPSPQNGWLHVGHMDEYIQFLPADSPRGWVMVVADPDKAMELFDKAAYAREGRTVAFSHPAADEGTVTDVLTIDQVLRLHSFDSHNEEASSLIDATVKMIKDETGLGDHEIIRVPTFFYATGDYLYKNSGKDRKDTSRKSSQMASLFGNVVNGISYKAKHYLAPKPWGPIVNGVDILEEAVIEAFGSHGYTVEFEDTWFSHHVLGGELHCGTNEMRRVSNKWWELPSLEAGDTTTTTTVSADNS